MNRIHASLRRLPALELFTLRGFLAIVIGLAPYTSVSQAQTYAVVDLGWQGSTPGGGAPHSHINRNGQVAGSGNYYVYGATHGYLYSNGTKTDLGSLGQYPTNANGINNNGQVVGDSTTLAGYTHAFLYSGGTMSDLGTLPGGNQSSAMAINDPGQIVGWSTAAGTGTNSHAFLYSAGQMIDLAPLIGGTGSQALDINTSGDVVGFFITFGGRQHAFLYHGGAVTDLGNLFNGGSTDSAAFRVSDHEQILIGAGSLGVFIYNTDSSQLTSIPAFPGGSTGYMSPAGMNNLGQAVGASTICCPYRGFLYSEGITRDLNVPVLPAFVLFAWDINDGGQIPVWGGEEYLLTPSTGTIEVTTNLSSATFTIDGPSSYIGGGTWFPQPNAPPGAYTVTFNPKSGYTIPGPQTRTLAAGGTITFSGTYNTAAGTITITSNLPQATFSISPPIPNAPTGGPYPVTIPSVSPGTYTVTFGQLLGYSVQQPAQQSVIAGGPPASFTAVYSPTITVTSTPPGATFKLQGPGLYYYSGTTPATITLAPVGDYTITWDILLGGYITPAPEKKHLDLNTPITFVGTYARRPLAIVVPGFGASALTDANQANQWLSCSSIVSLHNGMLTPVQYDLSGNPLPGFALTPKEVLAQTDQIANAVKPSTQSLVQCDNTSLLSMVDAARSWGGLGLGALCTQQTGSNIGAAYRTCLQTEIVEHSNGVLLQFNALSNRLQAEGYNPVAWPYDFRRDVSALANELYTYINQVSATNLGRPVVIITHSMGSIVTAALIQQHPDIYNSNLLQMVISMGAPFGGALKSYLAAQGWEHFVPFVSASNTKTMGQNWTSVYDLLPQWDFVTKLSPPYLTKYQVFDGTGDPGDFPPLSRVDALPGAYNLWSRLASLGPLPRWWAIIGFGQPTEAQLTQRIKLDNTTCTTTTCLLAHPCWFKDYGDGDGTVPLVHSAQAGLIAGHQIYVNQQHSALPGTPAVIDGIVKILKGDSPLTVVGLQSQPDQFSAPPTVQLKSCSPVDLVATNSAGQSVGDDGIQISGADYSKIAGSTQISVPPNANYTLQAKGTGLGTYDLVIRYLDATQQATQTAVIQGLAGIGSATTYQIGATGSGLASIVLVATFQSTVADINNALQLGLIDNQGIANSLSQKIQAAQAANKPAQVNILNAFLNELGAQAGKHVTGIAIDVLSGDAKSLIAQAQQ